MNSPSRAGAASAVVVNHNGGVLLARCLASLRDQGDALAEIVVVDSASTDGSLALVRDAFPDVRLLGLSENRGYAGAANVAVGATSGAYLLLVNADVVLTPAYVRTLVGFADAHPDTGSVTGKLLRLPVGARGPVIDSTGHRLDRSRWVVNRGEDEPDTGQYEAAGEVFGISGAAPLYRRTMLEDVRVSGEVFAESFFLYLEDVDLDWRARLRGWRAAYVPTAVAYHVRGQKPGRRSRDPAVLRHALKNRYLLMLRNDRLRDVLRDAWAILPFELLRAADYLVTAPRSLLGYVDVLRLLPRTLRQRRAIQRGARAPGHALRRWLGEAPDPARLLGRARRRLAGRDPA